MVFAFGVWVLLIYGFSFVGVVVCDRNCFLFTVRGFDFVLGVTLTGGVGGVVED